MVNNDMVGGIPTHLKNITQSVGVTISNILEKLFQTTNQIYIYIYMGKL